MVKNPIRLPKVAVSGALATALFASASMNAGAASNEPAASALPNAASVEADTYRVEMTAAAPYKSGATGTVKITLTAKSGYHINDQYPYRFKASSPAEGVSYPKPVLERADGQFQEKTAVFTLPFVAARAGKFALGGVLNLSVCSPANCIVQKAPLDLSVTVQ